MSKRKVESLDDSDVDAAKSAKTDSDMDAAKTDSNAGKDEKKVGRVMPTETIAVTIQNSKHIQWQIRYDSEFESESRGKDPDSNYYDWLLDCRSARQAAREKEAIEFETAQRRKMFIDTIDEFPRVLIVDRDGHVYSAPVSTMTKGAKEVLFGSAGVTEEHRAHFEAWRFGWVDVKRTKGIPLDPSRFTELIVV